MNVTIDRLKPAYLLSQENPEEKELIISRDACVKNTLALRPVEIQTKEIFLNLNINQL